MLMASSALKVSYPSASMTYSRPFRRNSCKVVNDLVTIDDPTWKYGVHTGGWSEGGHIRIEIFVPRFTPAERELWRAVWVGYPIFGICFVICWKFSTNFTHSWKRCKYTRRNRHKYIIDGPSDDVIDVNKSCSSFCLLMFTRIRLIISTQRHLIYCTSLRSGSAQRTAYKVVDDENIKVCWISRRFFSCARRCPLVINEIFMYSFNVTNTIFCYYLFTWKLNTKITKQKPFLREWVI